MPHVRVQQLFVPEHSVLLQDVYHLPIFRSVSCFFGFWPGFLQSEGIRRRTSESSLRSNGSIHSFEISTSIDLVGIEDKVVDVIASAVVVPED
jgi:hypothetical protein